MAERDLKVDHVTIWRFVQHYAPELNRRCRPELRRTNGSWRVDETYLRVAGKWTYLYRAVDSTGATIDFLLSARRDAAVAKRFLKKALQGRVSKGDCGTEENRRIGTALPLSPDPLLKQYRGAGSSCHQTTREGKSRLPMVLGSCENDPGSGDDEHDPQGTNEMVGQGRYRWSGCVHHRTA